MRGIALQLQSGAVLELSEREIIATTYAVNNLRDIESRQTHYTNTFKLPLTQANCEALELPEHINTFSRLPYRKLRVRILEDDTIVLDGIMRLISVTDGMLDAEIVGGNYNFFELIEGQKLSDIDLSGFSHKWNIANILDTQVHTWPDGYIYPVADYGKHLGDRKTVDDFYPAVFVKYLISQIARKVSYRIKGGFWESSKIDRMLIMPYTFPKLDKAYTDARSFRVGYTGTERYEYRSRPGNDSELVVNAILNNDNDPARDFVDGSKNVYNTSNGVATIRGTGIYQASTTFHTMCDGPVFFAAQLLKNGQIIQDKAVNKFRFGEKFETLTFDFDPFFALENDTITLRYKVAKRGTYNVANANIYLDDKTVFKLEMLPFVIPGADIDVGSVLPDLEQKDLLLLIANQFNLLFITDTRNRILRIEPFDVVPTSWRKAVDMSERLDFSLPPELSYELDDYGQNTILGYDRDKKDQLTWPGKIVLDNHHLEKEVIGYESDFTLQGEPIIEIKEKNRFSVWFDGGIYTQSPIQDYVYYRGKYYKATVNNPTSRPPGVSPSPPLNIPTPNLQWQEINYLEYLQLFNLLSVESPLAMLDDDNTETVRIYDGPAESIYRANITIEPLKFDLLVKQNYRYLAAALSNGKFVRVLLRLDSVDIQQLDFARPIRLQSDHVRYGQMVTGYFFIQQVDQYQHGQGDSTWIDLIRIELPQLTSVTTPTDEKDYLIMPDDGYVLMPDSGRIIVQ